MAPRAVPRGTSSGPAIRGMRGSAAPRGNTIRVGLPTGAHVTTIGVKRPNFGTGGRQLDIHVNSFSTTIPEGVIHHYDVVISPSEKTLPARLNMEIIKNLQTRTASEIFTPRAVYDGRKNMFTVRELPFGESGIKDFDVALIDGRPSDSTHAAKTYKVTLKKVAEINPEVLKRFINGDQSHDNSVLTAITALNVVIRMEPTLNYPFNVRSFFTDQETKDIGSGIQLWRGYFQSVRPGIGQMFINIDISTATMFKAGSLMRICLEYLKRESPMALSRENLLERDLLRLQRFVSGIRITTKSQNSSGGRPPVPRVIKRLTRLAAKDEIFSMREGGQISVADYFRQLNNKPLAYPTLICVEVGSGAKIPLELCDVPPGQIMKKQIPSDKTKDVLEFATKRPRERLESIRRGLNVLAYGQSEYVRQFGMHVDATQPKVVKARVLAPPTLRYGSTSKQPTIVPNNGAWNMISKKFYSPAAPINAWGIVCFETPNRLSQTAMQEVAAGLMKGCEEVGISINRPMCLKYASSQARVVDTLKEAGDEIIARAKLPSGQPPRLLVVILPEGGNEIYTEVKHFGDIVYGVFTQCLKSSKCSRAKPQYFANVCLKLNVKLGGINTVPDPSSALALSDPNHPTMVMGADVIHPAPGSDGKPSFTSLVANVDSECAKYCATSRVQTSRQEMIADIYDMSRTLIEKYMSFRQHVEKKAQIASQPKRIIFYRDGVSEGQFKQVLEQELPELKRACQDLRVNAKITVIVVGKRHHVRFFPISERDGDRSGNCPAGTVVDREIAHPTEFDFYLQSHGGLLGTSRPAHYSVLHDENGFNADTLQNLSFTLCHVYARSTRSVSIPAPVYYADIVCSRARNHFDPREHWDFLGSDDASSTGPRGQPESLERFQKAFKPLHSRQSFVMYFS